ncbi:MAG TPA: low affinity iron permease family protein [Thermoanaerobaculia bacterium]
MQDRRSPKEPGMTSALSRFATWVSDAAGSTPAFIAAMAVIIVWLASGPHFKYSDTWQLVINTSTTIVTFLMVFLIQRAQNKGALSLGQILDRDEPVARALERRDDLVQQLAQMAKSDHSLSDSHSIEEANERHAFKRDRRKQRHASGDGTR